VGVTELQGWLYGRKSVGCWQWGSPVHPVQSVLNILSGFIYLHCQTASEIWVKYGESEGLRLVRR